MTKVQLPETMTLDKIEALRSAFGWFYDQELNKPFIDKSTGFKFNDVTQYVDYLNSDEIGIQPKTSAKHIGIILEQWYENLTQTPTPEYEQADQTEVPQYESQSQTTLDSSTLEQLEKEADVRQQQRQETIENSKRVVEEAQQKLRDVKARNDEILKKLEIQKDKKLYVKIESSQEKEFTREEALDFDNYKEYLKSVKTDEIPEAVEKLAQEMESRIGESLKKQGLEEDDIKLVTENTAAEVIDNLIQSSQENYVPPTHYVAVTNTFGEHPEEIAKITSDKETQELIKENIHGVLTQAQLQVNISREFTERAFGKEFASRVFGPKPENLTVNISETPKPIYTEAYTPYAAVRGAQMSLENQDQNLEELKQRGLEEGKRVLIQDARSLIRQRLELIHPQSAAGKFLQSNRGDFILRSFGVGPQDGLSAVESLAIRVGLPITAGVRTAIWAKATTQTAISIANTGGIMQMEAFLGGAGQAASQAAVKTGLLTTAGSLLTKGAAAIGVSLGAFTFGVSTAVTLVLTAIGKMINWPKVKEWLRKNGWILGFGAVAINPWLGIGLAGAMYGLTRQIRLAAIGAGIWGFFGAIGSAFAMTIATPVIVTLLVLPPLVAFIMLVINTGAYLVPPDLKSLGINVDNPYILVTKIASPDTMGNFSGTTKVTYTVTITALKDSLTNLSIVDKKCTVSKKNVSTITPCPEGLENIPDLPNDLTVSPTSPYSFTFDAEYDSKYLDSLIFDSITIKADAGEKKGITTTGSESVCIGDCPHGCFEFVGNDENWPSNYQSILDGAIQETMAEFPDFIDKVCSEGTVNLCYTTDSPAEVMGTGGHCSGTNYAYHAHDMSTNNCDTYFNQCGLDGEQSDAKFLFVHEMSHHVQKQGGDMINRYKNFGAPAELPLCSYSGTLNNDGTVNIDEGSAEANALYANGGTASFSTCSMNFRSQYPNNYNFASDYMNNP